MVLNSLSVQVLIDSVRIFVNIEMISQIATNTTNEGGDLFNCSTCLQN